MTVHRHLDRLPESARGGAVAIGNFDGVHLGHRRIVARLLERARELAGPAVVFTFDPHPVRLLRPQECPPPLSWTERKAELLAGIGVDLIVAYPTDLALLQLGAREFFDRIVVGALAAKALVEGPNFYFGHNREGDVGTLQTLAAEQGITLDVVTPVEIAGQLVSSSRIRKLIATGDVALATQMLGAPYRIRGLVTHGAGRGASIGFPTANLAGVDALLPALGVYAGRAWADGQLHTAAINVGPNPTFGDSGVKVEVHLLDGEVELYGKTLEVEFLAKLRDVRQFGSVEELVTQLKSDVAAAREIAAG